MDIKSSIIKYCNELNLDTLGFIKCRSFEELIPFYKKRKENNLENEFEEKDLDLRINPNHYMSEGKTIISIAFPYIHDFKFDSNEGFSKYTQGRDYHIVVREYLNKICSFINTLGGKAMAFVDNNTLPERYIAFMAGLGFIGKNNMLITPKYGSFVFLGEIIMDLELETYDESSRSFSTIENYKECGECEICFRSCPTKAINRGNKNPNICLSYITQKKQIEDLWFSKLGDRIFGCDSCQKKCPYNIKAEASILQEFLPLKYMAEIDIEELINLDNKTFKEKYAITASGWRGKTLLQRNALIRSFHRKEIENIPIKSINSPYIEGYYKRLLNYFKL